MAVEEELAAVLAVLAVIQTPTTPAERTKPEWSAPARLHRRTSLVSSIHRGWVTSGRPH